MGRQQFSAKHQLVFRFFKAFLFLGVISIIITLSLICKLSLKDMIVCCLAFLPTGWGLLLVRFDQKPMWNLLCVYAWIHMKPCITFVSDCTSCEAQDPEHLAVGFYACACTSIWLWNGSDFVYSSRVFGMASDCSGFPDSIPLQRGIQQRSAYSIYSYWKDKKEMTINSILLC